MHCMVEASMYTEYMRYLYRQKHLWETRPQDVFISTCPNTDGPFQGPGYIGPASTSNWPGKGELKLKLKLKLIYDRHSVGQSVLVSSAHLGPLTNFSFAMKFSRLGCREAGV
jgi:hypothetical protein